MRPDQYQRLRDLSERLADVVLDEADPDTWPGHGKPSAMWTQQERGDRYWCKKNAASTFTLLTRTMELSGDMPSLLVEPGDMEERITQAERSAEKLLTQAMNKAKGEAGLAKPRGK